LGEEAGGDRVQTGWIVDPLDGTTNFLRGVYAVGVSVGLVVDGRPLVGAVGAPLLGEVFSAVEGLGAFRNGERIRVSERPAEHAIVATGMPFRRKEEFDSYRPVFERAFHQFEDLRRIGAASLDLAWTAAGVLDGYFELFLGPWDVAAGALLVREAGGVVTDWSGDPDAWLDSGCIVAASPTVHSGLLALTSARSEASTEGSSSESAGIFVGRRSDHTSAPNES
jgi:myo-inositol-1(or 4)-monophosphatase